MSHFISLKTKVKLQLDRSAFKRAFEQGEMHPVGAIIFKNECCGGFLVNWLHGVS
jgi:hypothetical protein